MKAIRQQMLVRLIFVRLVLACGHGRNEPKTGIHYASCESPSVSRAICKGVMHFASPMQRLYKRYGHLNLLLLFDPVLQVLWEKHDNPNLPNRDFLKVFQSIAHHFLVS